MKARKRVPRKTPQKDPLEIYIEEISDRLQIIANATSATAKGLERIRLKLDENNQALKMITQVMEVLITELSQPKKQYEQPVPPPPPTQQPQLEELELGG